jgi:hypothetical protein
MHEHGNNLRMGCDGRIEGRRVPSDLRPSRGPAPRLGRLHFVARGQDLVEIAWRSAMNSFIWRSQIRYDKEIQSCKRKRMDPGGPLMRPPRSLPKTADTNRRSRT